MFVMGDITLVGQTSHINRRAVEVQRRNTGKEPRRKVMSEVATKQEENKQRRLVRVKEVNWTSHTH